VHFAAGPWFTVIESGEDDWQDLGRVWLSDAQASGPGLLQYRVKFADEEFPS